MNFMKTVLQSKVFQYMFSSDQKALKVVGFIRSIALLFTIVHADPFVDLKFNCKVSLSYNEASVVISLL